jgi:hypothetical protein
MTLAGRELWRARSAPGPRDDGRLCLLLVGAGYLLLFCFNRFPLDQYLIVLLPLLALFSTEVFDRVAAPRPRAWLEGAAVFGAVILAAVLILYPSNRAQREVQDLVLSSTAPDDPVFLPPPYNPVFRRDGGYFWYNGALIANAYADYCATRPCPDDKRLLDERRWSSRPPRFVYAEDPEYFPMRWEERSRGYVPTELPRLFRAGVATGAASRGTSP